MALIGWSSILTLTHTLSQCVSHAVHVMLNDITHPLPHHLWAYVRGWQKGMQRSKVIVREERLDHWGLRLPVCWHDWVFSMQLSQNSHNSLDRIKIYIYIWGESEENEKCKTFLVFKLMTVFIYSNVLNVILFMYNIPAISHPHVTLMTYVTLVLLKVSSCEERVFVVWLWLNCDRLYKLSWIE